MGRTERYVLGLIEQLLGPGERGKRFDWARGDPGRTGRTVALPFDGVWEQLRLIVEVDEDQHGEATPFFDKPHRLTVSKVHRGEQRRLYDERKRSAARAQGYRVLAIPWSRRRPQGLGDLDEVAALLRGAGLPGSAGLGPVAGARNPAPMTGSVVSEPGASRSRSRAGPPDPRSRRRR